jgi:sortase A
MTTPARVIVAVGTEVADAPATNRTSTTPSPEPSKPGRPWGPPQAIGVAVTTLAVLLAGFLCFLLIGSGIAEHRAQDNLYASFRGQLSKAVAPTGPVVTGKPVALLEIPTLKIRDVVVEGTTSGALATGPGLRRDSVLPGQHGTSVIYGRRKAYGGPFSHVLSLRPGDEITTTTGLGVAHYRVTQLRDASSPFQVTPGVVPDQLILVTSDAPLAPTRTVLVVSTLVGKPSPAPNARPAIGDAEKPLHGDGSAALPLAWWSLALVISVAAAGVAAVRWSRAGAYLLATPLVLAILWNVYESVGRLLPNTL